MATTKVRITADAHMVVCARREGYAVITSDPLDLRRLETRLQVVAV